MPESTREKQGAIGEAEPDWVGELRLRAATVYTDIGPPTSRDEEWKHNPVGKSLSRTFDPTPPDAPTEMEIDLPKFDCAARLVFVDGRFAPGLSSPLTNGEGLRVESLRTALESAGNGVPSWLGRCADFESRGLAALNTAVAADGALVVLDGGTTVGETVHLVYLTTDASAGRMSHIRNLVVAGKGSAGRVLEHHVGPGADSVTNLVTEIAVEDGANLQFTKLVEGNDPSVHLASIEGLVSRDGHLGVQVLSAGGTNCRTETRVRLTGRGAECDLGLAALGRGGQVQDQLTRVEHDAPDTTSLQLHRAVVEDKARSIFNGLVVVRPGAHGTSGEQSSRNLVLSKTANAHTRPQLDISEDDVRCAHGATIGALDPAALFYLRSRGIGPADAQRLLVRAFVAEVVTKVPEGPAREEAGRLVEEWLAS